MSVVEGEAVKSEDIRFALRGRTRREHEQLDSHPAFAAMTARTLTLHHYRGIMQALHDVYCVLDPAIGTACRAFDAEELGFTYAARMPLLAADLARLGASVSANPVTTSLNAIPEINSAPALAGILYVVEGSVLGGAMLHRSTRALVGDGDGRGNGYWSWCARDGAARWAMTCRLLARLDTGPSARAEMADHARLAFGTIGRAFEPLARDMEREHAAC